MARTGRRRLAALAGRTLALAAAVALLGATGCATTVKKAELGTAPIAIGYLDPDQMRRNQESVNDRFADFERYNRVARGEGVARARDVTRFLEERFGGVGGEGPPNERSNRREPGRDSPRLAFLDVVSGELTIVRSARRGSLPVSWSPDRTRLLFSQIIKGYPQLFELEIASGQVRPITTEPRGHPWGCYGPEGRFVVESVEYAERPPLRRIEISDPGGHRFRRISDGSEGGDTRPACAPDGSAIAYVHGLGRAAQIVVRSPVLEGQPRVVARGIDPGFTTDSKVIVYSGVARKVRRATGVDDLWRIRRTRVNGTGRGAFPDGPLSEYEPAVSPDGKLIAYVGVDETFNRVLFVRRLDGTGERMLFNEGGALGPAW